MTSLSATGIAGGLVRPRAKAMHARRDGTSERTPGHDEHHERHGERHGQQKHAVIQGLEHAGHIWLAVPRERAVQLVLHQRSG